MIPLRIIHGWISIRYRFTIYRIFCIIRHSASMIMQFFDRERINPINAHKTIAFQIHTSWLFNAILPCAFCL